MKVPVSWLREYVDFDWPVEQLAAKLVFTSCEVHRILHRGVVDVDGNLGHFLVGRVVEAGKHPNADRLQLCLVDVGEGEPRQIVCGAWNFGAGATVAVALPGALLPGADAPLGEAKLRGETSRGMILSERELELGDDHSGIIVLENGFEPGTPLVDVLPLTESVLEIDTGFNRPDLTAIYGIAREVSALTGAELAAPPGREPERAGDEPVDVRVEDLEACPRYIGRIFRDASVGPSPVWLKARLLAAGMRSISNVVDVTNYVMLALGSPLHAFDRSLLAEGRIVVRRAGSGEKIRTLDGHERELAPTDLVIADARRPVAVAGIMGGEDSEVRDETTDLLLEAANFDALTVLRTSRRLRLRTEASTRWEKGVDPYAAEQAAVYATELLVAHAGARWTGHADVHGDAAGAAGRSPPARARRPAERDDVPGGGAARAAATARLRGRGRPGDGTDLAGERRDPLGRPRRGGRSLPDRGGALDPARAGRSLRAADQGAASAAAGRGRARRGRLRRGVHVDARPRGGGPARARGAVHDRDGRAPDRSSAGPPRVGRAEPERRRRPDRAVRGCARLPADRSRSCRRSAGTWPRSRRVGSSAPKAPPRPCTTPSACRSSSSTEAPDARRAPPTGSSTELPAEWGYFELDLDALFADVPEVVPYEDVITFPDVKQDLAFVVDEGVTAGELIAAAREAAGPELRDLRVFDVYRGEQVGAGKKSIALAAAFQSPERTLSDEDAAEIRGRIVAALAERFGAELRA